MRPADIAKVAHEINAAYCRSLGDMSQPEWAAAPDWQKQSAVEGVKFHLANPDAGPEASHANWMALKLSDGWKYGPIKNSTTKEHPCIMAFDQLPVAQRAKDYLFKATVTQLVPFLEPA